MLLPDYYEAFGLTRRALFEAHEALAAYGPDAIDERFSIQLLVEQFSALEQEFLKIDGFLVTADSPLTPRVSAKELRASAERLILRTATFRHTNEDAQDIYKVTASLVSTWEDLVPPKPAPPPSKRGR